MLLSESINFNSRFSCKLNDSAEEKRNTFIISGLVRKIYDKYLWAEIRASSPDP